MSSPGTQAVVKAERRTLLLRAPARAYFTGAMIGAAGALLPYVTTGALVPWQATPGALALGAIAALAAHALVHGLVARPEGRASRFAVATLAPAVLVGTASLLALFLVSSLRSSAYAAVVANAAASAADVWEAVAVLWLAPRTVREVADGIECELEVPG